MQYHITITTDYEMDSYEREKVAEIINAIVKAGGHSGVKGGKTILHFDGDGNFQGVQLDYWPWRKRKLK